MLKSPQGCDPNVSRLPSFWGALKGPFPTRSGVGRIQFLSAAGLRSMFSWWLSSEGHSEFLGGTPFPGLPSAPSSKSSTGQSPHILTSDQPGKDLHF